jgi:23S rRNA pseudouridine2605 synthase
VRLQRYLAHAGVASRRACEEIIAAGRVQVNGRIVSQLGALMDPACDRVAVDGVLLKPKRKLYLALNKPRGYLCTCRDPQKRKTLADLLPKDWSRLYSVGRLDRDSEGLIFLTNDGEFCLHLTHPRYAVRKQYVATVTGRVEPEYLARLTRGIELDGESLRAEKARLIESNNTHSRVAVELAEGKNREVRRLMQALGFTVERLQRVQIGSIKLGELPLGKWRTLTQSEIHSLQPRMQHEDE